MESHAASPTTSAPSGGWSFSAGAKTSEPISATGESAAQLRARLLKLIVANESARTAATADASKPR